MKHINLVLSIIQFASDLHLEMNPNSVWLTKYPLIPKADVLLLSGDLTYLNESYLANPLLDQMSEQFSSVFVVPGNHEFYMRSFDIADCFPTLNLQVRPNITYLNNQSLYLDGCRIIFTTLFSYIHNHQLIENKVNDFHTYIYNGERFDTHNYNTCHEHCKHYLETELAKPFDGPTIIVSHYAPYPPEYCAYNFSVLLNEAFHVDMTWILEKYRIDHWIHGHTHHNLESFRIGNTWFHTNQLDYSFRNEHEPFNTSAVIEI